MAPGRLVKGKDLQALRLGQPTLGVLLRRVTDTQVRFADNVWWEVLCEDGVVVEEIERYMEVIA